MNVWGVKQLNQYLLVITWVTHSKEIRNAWLLPERKVKQRLGLKKILVTHCFSEAT